MTSFADLVDARWRLLAEPDDPAGRLRYDLMREHFERKHGRIAAAHWSRREAARASSVLSGRAQRLAVADLFTRSRHVMAALEAS
jgi:hypothetical protein